MENKKHLDVKGKAACGQVGNLKLSEKQREVTCRKCKLTRDYEGLYSKNPSSI